MRQITATFAAAFISAFFLTALAARAQGVFFPEPAVTFSTGYSNLQTQKSQSLFYDHSGAYFDADVAWSPPLRLPLLVGFGVTGSGYWDRKSVTAPASEDFDFPYYHLYSDAGLFELEPRVGLRLGRDTGFFAVPRIGAGLLIDSYSIDQSFTSDGTTYLSTRNHDGAAFEVRPAIQVGYSWGYVSAGAEASYMYAVGDFGGLGHHAQEVRIGAFVNFRL
jgi:hypothetical protein